MSILTAPAYHSQDRLSSSPFPFFAQMLSGLLVFGNQTVEGEGGASECSMIRDDAAAEKFLVAAKRPASAS